MVSFHLLQTRGKDLVVAPSKSGPALACLALTAATLSGVVGRSCLLFASMGKAVAL
jgi:hypothetical protein